MSHLIVPKAECIESIDNYGRFVAEPMEKGFGVTIGNAMRRVLLGQLQGAAVTRVQIEGIQHEFSTIPYVKEDATEFLLNVKALRIKSLSNQPGKMVLEKEGEGAVYASDIQSTSDFEIANPELYLATMDSPEAKLYVEFDVELSKGYEEAESTDNLALGVIPIDAIFSPIRNVNFTIEPIYIGQESSRERLNLEVWTDGTISPVDAVSKAAELLTEQCSPFIYSNQVAQAEAEKESGGPEISEELYNMPVEQLNLSVRTMNCLRRGGIATVGELASKSERDLMSLRNFGQKSNLEIQDRLETLGLSLVAIDDEGEDGESTEPEEEY